MLLKRLPARLRAAYKICPFRRGIDFFCWKSFRKRGRRQWGLLNETPLQRTKVAAISLPFPAIHFTISSGYFAAAQHVVVYHEDPFCTVPLAVIRAYTSFW